MKITRTFSPAKGEHVIGVSPPLDPNVNPGWYRRLNLYTGRSLSDTALRAEQQGRAGVLATRGQAVSPGIVTGLELDATRDPDGALFYTLCAGLGITARGEDVVVPSNVRIAAREVRVYAPAFVLRQLPIPDAFKDAAGFRASGRDLGQPLGEFIDQKINLPRVGILVVQPVVAERVGEFDSSDPCERDPQNDAFEDWQIVDGSRLIYFAYPTEMLELPPYSNTLAATWRNRIAYKIFEREAKLDAEAVIPWQEVGVPVALVAFDPDWNFLFVDRHAVARAGGKPKRRRFVSMPRTLRTSESDGGNPFLWQARINQFAEHLLEASIASPNGIASSAAFSYVAPSGLLPRAALELLDTAHAGGNTRVGAQNFFPAGFTVEVAPAPLEQLDAAIEASAGLAPFDLALTERVRVLVPVPQIWYEPKLLEIENVDPEFQQSLDELRTRRGRWLTRRADVRGKATLLHQAIHGSDTTPGYPDPDPEQLEPETLADPIDANDALLQNPETEYGTTLKEDGRVVDAVASLLAQLDSSPLTKEPETGDLAKLRKLGLERFAQLLQTRIDAADDKINFSFLRVHTDIYRLRQYVLGNVVGTRLAVSPALAEIAQGESAAATRQDLIKFYDKIKPTTGTLGAAAAETPESGEPSPGTLRAAAAESPLESFTPGILAANLIVAQPAASVNLIATQPAFSTRRDLGSVIEKPPSAIELVPSIKSPVATPIDIIGQPPLIGATPVRTTTIVERLKPPLAQEARESGIANKSETLTNFKDLAATGINFAGLELPVARDNQGKVVLKPLDQINPTTDVKDERAGSDDEGTRFTSAVDALDDTVAGLRLLEGRIQAYRLALAAVQKALDAVRAALAQANARLAQIGDELAEARHDVSLALALLADEQARVAAINARRDQILAEQVTFFCFYRPRTTELRRDAPARELNPGATESAVAACNVDDALVPDELRSYMALFRRVPANWFIHIPRLLDRFGALPQIVKTLQASQLRAQALTTEFINQPALMSATTKSFTAVSAPTAVTFGKSIASVLDAQTRVVTQTRFGAAKFDLNQIATADWQGVRTQAGNVVSLGDLIGQDDARSDVSNAAARELNDMTRVAACLYLRMGQVLPVLRLEWGERLSQYDAPVNLRNLASLPRWGEIEFVERRAMQELVDWLFGRMDNTQPQAVALVNDLVRVCILLASHAPVNRIVAGHLPQPTTATPGGQVNVRVIDPGKIRLGMSVLLYKQAQVAARAVVENVSADQVAVRVMSVPGALSGATSVTLDAGAVVHFSEQAGELTRAVSKPFGKFL